MELENRIVAYQVRFMGCRERENDNSCGFSEDKKQSSITCYYRAAYLR